MVSSDLVLRPPEPRHPRKRKAPAASANGQPADSVVVQRAFQVAYTERYGFPVIENHGRDRKLLKQLVEQWGLDETLRMVRVFFAATRRGGFGYEQVRRLRWHNVPDFYNGAQVLRRMQADGPDLADRTQSNVHEAMKAMGRPDGREGSK